MTNVCRKCGRELSPWPLGHPGCSPKDWVKCISTRDHPPGMLYPRNEGEWNDD